MRVTIEKFLIEKKDGIAVECRTEFGSWRALWVGEKPVPGNMYDIEIYIPYVLTWEHDIVLSEQRIFQMKENENTVSFIGMADSVKDDGLFFLRLGKDSILMQAEGMPFPEGTWVEIIIKDLIVYDCNT
ncbi:MAG: hypothetical protein M3Y81_06240 [Chloroflexota bacterium]|nr:hypothetical protein [Chloroflexota bacterium]